MPSPNPDKLIEQVRVVGETLQASLVEALNLVGGSHARPSHIARRLDMDTTAVWRVVRAALASSPISCVHNLPGPGALNDFRRAVERHAAVGVPDLTVAVALFEELLEEFPSGRRGLNAAIEGWLPAARERGLRTASQSAFRAYAQLIGCQIKGMAIASVLTPSRTPGLMDLIHVRLMHDIQRMRDGAEITLCGSHVLSMAPEAHSLAAMQRLGHSGPCLSIGDTLLDEFGSHPPVVTGTAEAGRTSMLTLPVGSPPVNRPATIALGYRMEGAWRSRQTKTIKNEWISTRYSIPVRLSVSDLVVPRSMWRGGLPEVVVNLHGGAIANPDTDREVYELTRIPLGVSSGPAMTLLPDLSNLDWVGAPAYAGAVRFAFEREGLDPADFVGFRVVMDHPVPMSTLTWFFALPE